MGDDAAKTERLIDEYAASGRKSEAVDLIYNLIVKYAKEKNFSKAETLREKLFEVDSMALNEIIKSAEVIEEEKSEAMDHNHMDIWANMYDTMTSEEANTLYFALKKASHDTDEVVFQQGRKNGRLYFVDSGQLKLVYSRGNDEKLIKTIGTGGIAGEDTFFSITVCTSSLITLSRVQMKYLEQQDYLSWQDSFPTLASKIETYCARVVKAHELLKKKNINRREHRRLKFGGPILFQVMNTAGKPIGKAFKGDLSDLSLGGLSFFIKTSNRNNALMLLGRKLRVKFRLPVGRRGPEVQQSGFITGVINHHFSDYSIHMKFDELLSRIVFKEVEEIPESERLGGVVKDDKSAL